MAAPSAEFIRHGVAYGLCGVEVVGEGGVVADKLGDVEARADHFGLGVPIEGEAKRLYGGDDGEGPGSACEGEVERGEVLVARDHAGVGGVVGGGGGEVEGGLLELEGLWHGHGERREEIGLGCCGVSRRDDAGGGGDSPSGRAARLRSRDRGRRVQRLQAGTRSREDGRARREGGAGRRGGEARL